MHINIIFQNEDYDFKTVTEDVENNSEIVLENTDKKMITEKELQISQPILGSLFIIINSFSDNILAVYI